MVRQTDEVRQEGYEVLVGIRGGEAVSEIEPLTRSRLVKTNKVTVSRNSTGIDDFGANSQDIINIAC